MIGIDYLKIDSLMAQPEYTVVKIIIVGPAGAGKTSILFREADDTFHQSYIATIGVDFKIKKYLVAGTHVKAQLWDNVGSNYGEKYSTISQAYYRATHAIALCFSLSDKEQLQSIPMRIQEARAVNQQAKIFLIGCKLDLGSNVQEEDIMQITSTEKIQYFKTSSKLNIGVHEAFQRILEQALKVKLSQKVPVNPIPKKKEQCEIM